LNWRRPTDLLISATTGSAKPSAIKKNKKEIRVSWRAPEDFWEISLEEFWERAKTMIKNHLEGARVRIRRPTTFCSEVQCQAETISRTLPKLEIQTRSLPTMPKWSENRRKAFKRVATRECSLIYKRDVCAK
jgi:hypothetical protein